MLQLNYKLFRPDTIRTGQMGLQREVFVKQCWSRLSKINSHLPKTVQSLPGLGQVMLELLRDKCRFDD